MPLIDSSAIYLFLLFKQEFYDEAIVAYVGMSTNLTQRIATHNILPQLAQPGLWPMIWFKPTPHQKLRDAERQHIERFDPPWNIIGRRRGLAATGGAMNHG